MSHRICNYDYVKRKDFVRWMSSSSWISRVTARCSRWKLERRYPRYFSTLYQELYVHRIELQSSTRIQHKSLFIQISQTLRKLSKNCHLTIKTPKYVTWSSFLVNNSTRLVWTTMNGFLPLIARVYAFGTGFWRIYRSGASIFSILDASINNW